MNEELEISRAVLQAMMYMYGTTQGIFAIITFLHGKRRIMPHLMIAIVSLTLSKLTIMNGDCMTQLSVAGLLMIMISITWTLIPEPPSSSNANRKRVLDYWQRMQDKHKDLLSSYYTAETDTDVRLTMPALTDPSIPETKDMLIAMQQAAQISNELPTWIADEAQAAAQPYPIAVSIFEQAWNRAYENAKQIGTCANRKDIRYL